MIELPSGVLYHGDNLILPKAPFLIYNGIENIPQNVEHLIIDSSVTFLEYRWFADYESLISVELRDGVKTI
jgi:hypothetical protein